MIWGLVSCRGTWMEKALASPWDHHAQTVLREDFVATIVSKTAHAVYDRRHLVAVYFVLVLLGLRCLHMQSPWARMDEHTSPMPL